ncbi:MAG: histidine kinase [Gemmatimonadota bacterium]|jgi:hypothetical protein
MSRSSLLRRPLLAHLGVWLVAGVVYFLAVLPFYGGPVLKLAAFKGGWTLIGWLIAEGLALLYRRTGVSRAGLPRAAVVVAPVSLAVAAAWVGVMAGISIAIQGNTLLFFTPTFFPFVLMNHVFIVMAWSGGYLALAYWRRSLAEEKRWLAAESEARAAQLQLLRRQLDPHFLFNALASVRALIADQPEAARRMVTRLSSFLRYALADEEHTWVRVSEELDILRAYLEIERVRFGERLEVTMDEDEGAAETLVPGMLLLSLVENAVKHGEEVDGRLRVDISATLVDRELRLAVENSGRLNGDRAASDGASTRDGGFGLRNLRARLASAYPGRASLALSQEGDVVRALIRIPEADDGP